MAKIINNELMLKQKGVVLIVALVFLVSLTAVAVALMQLSTTDMKMSGATEDKVAATQAAIGASDELIYRQLIGGTGTNDFAKSYNRADLFPHSVTDTLTLANTEGATTTGQIDIANNHYELEGSCPRVKVKNASSDGTFNCNVLTTRIRKTYGRKNATTSEQNSVIEVNSVIVQVLIGNN